MQHQPIGHDAAKSPVTFREMRNNLAESLPDGLEALLTAETGSPTINRQKSPKPESTATPAQAVDLYPTGEDVSFSEVVFRRRSLSEKGGEEIWGA